MLLGNTLNLDYLNKITFYDQISQQDINNIWFDISSYISNNIDRTNSLNDAMLLSLDITATKAQETLSSLTVLANSLADLSVIGGSSNTSFSPFEEEVRSLPDGAVLDKDLRIIKLQNQRVLNHRVKKVNIISRDGIIGNNREYSSRRYDNVDNIISTNSRLEIESYETHLVVAIEIELDSEQPVNNVIFNLEDFGSRFPTIESFEVGNVSKAWRKARMLVSNSLTMDLNEFRFKNNVFSIDIEESKAKYIRITFRQSDSYIPLNTDNTDAPRYAIGISALSIGFNGSTKSGEVVIGPFSSNNELLKISVNADIDRVNEAKDSVLFEISQTGENWFPIENSSMFIAGSERDKVIDFNTLKIGSIKTEEPVYQIYLKVILESIDASHLISDEKILRRFRGIINQFNNIINIGDTDPETVEVFEYKGYNFGTLSEFRGQSSVRTLRNIGIIDLEQDGLLIPKSMFKYPIRNTYNISDDTLDIIDSKPYKIITRPDRIHVKENEMISGHLSEDFDSSQLEVYSFSKPLTETLNVISLNNSVRFQDAIPVAVLNNKAGKYFIVVNNDTYELDLSSGFLYSNSEAVFFIRDNPANLPPEERANRDIIPEELKVKIYDEIGTLVTSFDTSERYISLFDIFDFTLPTATDLEFSKTYPLTPLKSGEFALRYGEYIFAEPFSGEMQISRVRRSRSQFTVAESIDSSNYIILDRAKQIKESYKLQDYNFKKVIKLNHTNIVNDTVYFNARGASINAFIKEVPYIDGETEFTLIRRYSQNNNRNKSIIELDPGFIDDSQIEFEGDTSRFLSRVYTESELISEGDYFIYPDGGTFYIKFPEGVTTSDIFDTDIIYNIENSKQSASGLYSINYERGIIYTVAPVDSRITISYNYSFMFAKYEALQELDKSEFTATDSVVTINTDTSDAKPILVLAKNNDPAAQLNYLVSPIVSNLKINTITNEEFL